MSDAGRVVVAGAAGRLGRLAVEAIQASPDLELAGTLVRGDDPVPLLRPARTDLLLDLSLAAASRLLAPLAARAGVVPVVGVSGLSDDDRAALEAACVAGGVPGLLVPNFSLGAVLQMQAAVRVAAHLPCTELLERHHQTKRDRPSGTALETARRLEAAGATPPPIASERLPDVVAEQRLVFGGEGERLELLHVVRDRRAYLPGLLLALRRAPRLQGFAVGLEAVLDLD